MKFYLGLTIITALAVSSPKYSLSFFMGKYTILEKCSQISSIYGNPIENTFEQHDDHILLSIFDHLSEADLIRLAEVNQRFRELIRVHYIRSRLNNEVLKITGSKFGGYVVHNYVTVLKFLHIFGDLIKTLTFVNFSNEPVFTTEEESMIAHYIERYCSETLINVELNGAGLYLLTETNEIFEKVTSVQLRHVDGYSDNLNIDRIFPHMEELQIVLKYPLKLNSFLKTYSNLKHLELIEWGTYSTVTLLPDLILLNPHLRSLKLNYLPTTELLYFIDEHLPQLDSLAITCDLDLLISDSENLHMKNVKNFTVFIQGRLRRHIPITFEHLEMLEIKIDSFHEEIGHLFQQNDKIHILSLPWIQQNISFNRVLESIEQLSELKDITIGWSSKVGVSNALRLFNDFPTLKKIKFLIADGNELEHLLEIVPREWKCIDIQSHYKAKDVTFIRYWAS